MNLIQTMSIKTDIQIITLNVRGLNDKKKRQELFYWLRKQDVDIIALHETHLGKDNDEWRWTREWDGQSYWTNVSTNSKGVALLFNRKFKYDILNIQKEKSGRLISASVKFGDKCVRLVCVYAPNDGNERVKFFRSTVEEHIDNEEHTILLGDFNCTLHDVERYGDVKRKEVGREELEALMKRQKLSDVYRKRHPDSTSFTYFKPNSSIRSRIDFILLSEIMDVWVQDVRIITSVRSDHNAVKVKLKMVDEARGAGRWKMSKKVIESNLFKETFKQYWTSWKECKDQFANRRVWWSESKENIKEIAMWSACQLRQKENGEVKILESTLSKECNKMNPDQVKVEGLRNKLQEINRHKTEGARIRAGVRWFEEGETSSAYFHNLEKKRMGERMWSSIKTKEGNVIEGTANIIERQREFYTYLYAKTEINRDAADELLTNVDTKLNDEEKEMCDARVQYDEVKQVVKGLRSGCSPGIDGIINEFYKLYWSVIGEDFVEVINEIEQDGQLAPNQNLGVITLLYKAGDRNDLSNWRPITVLNSDYKIIEKILSNRMKHVLGRIVQNDQKAYLANRQIGENVRLNEDVIFYCEKYKKPGAVLYVDQSKAFDRVNWEWLNMVLRHYGFGESYINWIKILYTNASSTIFTNGFLSERFKIERGVRQGSPLGPYLYILQSEPLADAIRKDPNIKGIEVPDLRGGFTEIKMGAFADDTQGYVSTMESVDGWFYHLGVYSRASGAVINEDKTKGTLLGTLKNIQERNATIMWDEGPITALGVNQGTNRGEAEFWRKKIVKMKHKLQAWKMRNLTLTGKSYLLNSVGLSVLNYAAELQCVPEDVVKEVNTMVWDFIWSGKKDKVKRHVCNRRVLEGGINAPNFTELIRASRLKMLSKVIQPGNEKWKALPRFFLRIGGTNSLLTGRGGNKKIPQYYRECVDTWQDLKCDKKPRIKTVYDIINGNNLGELACQKLLVKHPDQNSEWCDIGKMTRAGIQSLLRGPLLKSRSELLWEGKYGNINWEKIYETMKLKVIPRKVREFHWKAINFAVYTEHRIKHLATSDGMCCLCGSETEDLTHMLFDCETISEFWKSVIIMIRQNVPTFVYNEACALLGCIEENTGNTIKKELDIANVLILNAKWIIWKRRCTRRYEGTYITQEVMWLWYTEHIQNMINMRKFIQSNTCRTLLGGVIITE